MTDSERQALREAYLRSIAADRGDVPPAKKKGPPKAQPEGYFDRATGKVRPFSADSKEVQKATADWATGFMRAGAAMSVREALKKGSIVSYTVPHEQEDRIHVGRVVDSDTGTSSVHIQEYVPSDDGDGYTASSTHHFLALRDVKQVHSTFPDLEAGDRDDDDAEDDDDEDPEKVEAQVRASFKRFYFANRRGQ